MSFGVLFDFDGTLVDTFDGIVDGVVRMRARLGAGPLPAAEIRAHIGWGIGNLVGQNHPTLDRRRRAGLPPDGDPLPLDAKDLQHAIDIFREEYAQGLVEGCRVYPGIAELCAELVRDGFRLAVVSNKPERFTRRILAGKGLVDPFVIVLGGDSLPTMKPDSEPLNHAARVLGVPIERCVMVGDSLIDLEAGRSAGARVCAVAWGLLPAERLAGWRPDHLASTVEELRAWLYRVRSG